MLDANNGSIRFSLFLFLLESYFPMLSMGHIAFLYAVRFAHVLPVLHIQSNNCLFGCPHVMVVHGSNCGSWLPPKLLDIIRTPCLDARLPLLDQKAEMKHIFDRLSEALGVEQHVDCVDGRVFNNKLFRLLLHNALVPDLLRQLGLIVLCLLNGRRVPYCRPLSQRLFNDADMSFDRTQFIPS